MSWIRSRDLRILSIGEVRYTRDSRFTPLHDAGNDVWALKIADAEMADSGEYECQASDQATTSLGGKFKKSNPISKSLLQVSYHDDIEKEMKMRVSLLVLGK